MRWDKGLIADTLRKLHARGDDISFSGQRGSGLWSAAIRFFGSYRNAVEAAGIDYAQLNRRNVTKWDRERIVADLKRLHRLNVPLHSRRIRRAHGEIHAAAISWFGSYRKAVEAAGIEYTSVQRQIPGRWTRQTIIAEIRRLHSTRQPLHHHAVSGSGMVCAAYRCFGTYRKAIEAAGIDYLSVRTRPQRIWNSARVLAELKKLDREGRDLRYTALRKAGRFDVLQASAREFGSYGMAIKAAGLEYPKPPLRHWTRQLVLSMLTELNEGAVDLRHSAIQRKHLQLFEAARYYFGSYANAVAEAGIDYDAIVRRQLSTRPRRRAIAI